MCKIYRFITFLGIEIFFIKQCPLKFMSVNTGLSFKKKKSWCKIAV